MNDDARDLPASLRVAAVRHRDMDDGARAVEQAPHFGGTLVA
jgi:hypothetical protein